MARKAHYSHPTPVGILGTYPTDPEVIAVFPELSSTVIPHAQEVRLRRGDDLDLGFQLQNDQDPADVVLIDGVVRWAAKQGYGRTERPELVLGNEAALIVKRSSEVTEIELLGGGRGVVKLHRDDTYDLPLAPALWDLEVTQAGAAIALPPGAQVQLLPNLTTVTAVGFTWPNELMPGDIMDVQGRRVLVVEKISPTHVGVDWEDWQLATETVALFRGKTKTVASGPFVVEGDVVR